MNENILNLKDSEINSFKIQNLANADNDNSKYQIIRSKYNNEYLSIKEKDYKLDIKTENDKTFQFNKKQNEDNLNNIKDISIDNDNIPIYS